MPAKTPREILFTDCFDLVLELPRRRLLGSRLQTAHMFVDWLGCSEHFPEPPGYEALRLRCLKLAVKVPPDELGRGTVFDYAEKLVANSVAAATRGRRRAA